MRRIHDVAVAHGGRVERQSAFKLSVAAMLLAAALSLAGVATAAAQSYDPDLGSGNIARTYGGARYFGHINPAWRASVYHRRHVRHRHAR
jgi:hypothetical protein